MNIKRAMLVLTAVLAFGVLIPAEAKVYTIGDQATQVADAQRKLRQYGYNLKVNGKYSKAMAKAVRDFQKKNKLAADGILGPATYFALTGVKMESSGAKVKAPGKKQGKTKTTAGSLTMGIDDYTVQWQKPAKLTGKVKSLISTSQKYIGVPYRFGGTTPKGFDCSGYMQYVFHKNGILLPRSADDQYMDGKPVSVNALRPGDLVFFNTYDKGISHSGMYLGNGYFISATTSRGVAVATMKSGYWHDRYMGARRVL